MTTLHNIIGYGCRSLQAWQQHGRPHSELLRSQREGEGGSTLGGPLRYPDTLIFWVQCQQVSSTVEYSSSPPPPPPPSVRFSPSPLSQVKMMILIMMIISIRIPNHPPPPSQPSQWASKYWIDITGNDVQESISPVRVQKQLEMDPMRLLESGRIIESIAEIEKESQILVPMITNNDSSRSSKFLINRYWGSVSFSKKLLMMERGR